MLMADLGVKEVEHIANLAKLKLSKKELKVFAKQLSDTLNFISDLNELNTKSVEPTSHVTGLKNVYFNDTLKPSLTQEEALSQSKKVHNGYFVVKMLLENR